MFIGVDREGQTGLADKRLKRADPNLTMIRYRHSHRHIWKTLLHDNMAAALTSFGKSMLH